MARMSVRMRWLAFALIVFGVAATLFWVYSSRAPLGVSEAGFAAINNGMTLKEVEAVIGKPPNVGEGGGLDLIGYGPMGWFPPPVYHSIKGWAEPQGTTCVYFDEADVVLGKRHIVNIPEPPGIWKRILRAFGG